MYIIEVTEHKLNKATDYAEKMLKYGGMLMQCLTEWSEEGGFGERGGMNERYPYMGMRDDEDYEDEMNERRGGRRRRSNGRYY